jgi:hypothetical protein
MIGSPLSFCSPTLPVSMPILAANAMIMINYTETLFANLTTEIANNASMAQLLFPGKFTLNLHLIEHMSKYDILANK